MNNFAMVLKPQDVLVLLKLVVIREKPWSYSKLANQLGMSPAEVHAAVKRLRAARLLDQEGERLVPNRRNLSEFLAFGLRYVFIPERGEMTRGMPTLYAAPPLDDLIVASTDPIPVWPDREGEARGSSFSPLYKSVPKAARADPALYELLVLVDAVRGGQARERALAVAELHRRLDSDKALAKEGMREVPDTLLIAGSIPVSRAELQALTRKHHIRRLQLFGSAARGELHPDSDIDLLVEFEKGKAPSLWKMVGLEDEFSALFGGRRVDLATPVILENPYRRRTIEPDLTVLIDEAA